MSANTGPDARTGAATVMGRCFMAKYANTQEDPTMTDLRRKNKCASRPTEGICHGYPDENPGNARETATNGANISAPVNEAKNKTGNTALSLSDNFLKTS